MCVKCDGTGRLYTRVMSGAWLVTSCNCEDAEKVRQEEEIKMREWRKRLAEACERLGITQDIVWEAGDHVGHPL
ncbi:hypothetical protein GYMC52_2947 [Geobacillus sp. Y412MC52]|nr:hypothetical protein GYMC52_2947 [Geobacillus sp. Y412MC52]